MNAAGVPVAAAPAAAGAVAASAVTPQLGTSVVLPEATLVSAVATGPAASPVSVAASTGGAGTLGFAGTAAKQNAGDPCGLTMLANDEPGGPTVPMLPATWVPQWFGEAAVGGVG
ncbi:PPW family C-terminal domain-containing PPE protein [Mycobacterium lacus]|nr:hypothetical protein [Mycobacterium lacus]